MVRRKKLADAIPLSMSVPNAGFATSFFNRAFSALSSLSRFAPGPFKPTSRLTRQAHRVCALGEFRSAWRAAHAHGGGAAARSTHPVVWFIPAPTRSGTVGSDGCACSGFAMQRGPTARLEPVVAARWTIGAQSPCMSIASVCQRAAAALEIQGSSRYRLPLRIASSAASPSRNTMQNFPTWAHRATRRQRGLRGLILSELVWG